MIYYPTIEGKRYTFRTATKADTKQIASLIDSVYREYGDRLQLEDADSDLLDIDSNYFSTGGTFVVVEDEKGQVIATHSVLPAVGKDGLCWFKRLYLHPAQRGSDMGNMLMNWAIVVAQSISLKRVEFWSDSRFHRAHQFFERFGFKRDGRERNMSDGSMPYSEYFFYLNLDEAKLVSILNIDSKDLIEVGSIGRLS